MTKHITTRSMTSAVALTASICATGFATGTATAAEPAKGWETVANAGITVTDGNSETILGTIGINSSRKWSKDEMLLGASAGYGKNRTGDSDDTTDHYIKGFGQWNHLFSDVLYGGARVDALYDRIADIDYRFTVSPLAGYYLIKKPNMTLAVEAGPSFIAEEVAGESDEYIALRFAERFEYKFNGGAKIWQFAEWLPQVDDFDNWILNVEVGVSAPITKSLDVRLVAQDTYDNRPAPGREENDFKLIAGVGYKF